MARASLIFLPASLLALVSQAKADQQAALTAVKKLAPDASEKLLAADLGFAATLAARGLPDGAELGLAGSERLFRPAFARHHDGPDVRRRAAEALARRSPACPAGMNSCAANKCCQQGTYCTDVPDTAVGQVACCPEGATCGGGVGSCPADAASCPAALGGGCCIPGYVCQGVGCVPSAAATPSSRAGETRTSTGTTAVTGGPAPGTEAPTAPGSPPWRPTGSGASDAAPSTQTGCPTGFYGCLATHGGGCCRTERGCHTRSCPAAAASTTVLANGATVAVPASSAPAPTCAGCCPSGYECGTASCLRAQASHTASARMEAPAKAAAARPVLGAVAACVLGLMA